MTVENEGNVKVEAAAAAPAETGTPVQQQASEAVRQQPDEPNWEEIEEQVSRGDRKVTIEESQQHAEWVAKGRPKKAEPQKQEQETAQPNGEPDLQAKDPLTYTDDEVARLQGLMKKFGADSLSDLPEKVKAYEDAQNARKGDMGRELQQLRSEVDQLRRGGKASGMEPEDLKLLLADAAAGKPEAFEWAKANLGLDLSAMRQQAQVAPAAKSEPFSIPEQPPEDVVDEAAWKHMRGMMLKMQEHYEGKITGMNQTVEELRKQSENGRQLAEQAKQIRKEQELRNQFHQQALRVIEGFPESYKPQSGNLGRMLDDLYDGKSVDPRLQPLQNLLAFAVEKNISDLEIAHYAQVGPKMRQTQAQMLAQAQMEGRRQVLEQPKAVGLAGKRAEAGEAAYTLVTPDQLDLIVAGRVPPPNAWWDASGTRLDPKKVPVEFHGKVFGEHDPRLKR